MRGRLTRNEKWAVVGGVTLVWSTVGDVGLNLHQAVSEELPPAALGALVGCVVALAVVAIVARFGLVSRWTRFRESDRWMGRPRYADWLIYLVEYTVGYCFVFGVVMRVDPPHLGELTLGLFDGIWITAVVAHLVRRSVTPPDAHPA